MTGEPGNIGRWPGPARGALGRPLLGGALLLVLALAGAPAQAQPAARQPRVGYVFPAGGQRGTTFLVTLGGQNLDQVQSARFTGPGITATVVEHYKPLGPGQASRIRDTLKELQERRRAAAEWTPPRGRPTATQPATRPAWTADDVALVADLLKKLADFAPKPSSPAIAETITLQVTISVDAAPGRREARLLTPWRATNPLAFHVGSLAEKSEAPARQRVEPRQSVPADEADISLPVVLNGQIMPGGVDRYHFQARRGQNLVAAVAARTLIPYIADAVPGWFQPAVKLTNARGLEVAYADDFRFSPDPLLQFRIPADGQYTLAIYDAIYRGREDFVYRLALGELPVVTGVFPLGGQVGARLTLETQGWNLVPPRLTFDAGQRVPGLYVLPMPDGRTLGAGTLLCLDSGPDSVEREPNDKPAQAEALTLPAIVNGRMAKAGDADVFRFTGRAGQQIVAEVLARRLGSPLDSVLALTDAAGRTLAGNDDHEDKGAGLITHHADSLLAATLPADGDYYLRLTDRQGAGGPDFAYRLRLGPPRPDFRLRVTPSSLTIRRVVSDPLTVHVLRREGFAGPIDLALVEGPPGFALSATQIPAEKSEFQVTIKAPLRQRAGVFPLDLQGQSLIQGRTVVHRAVPAEDMMQAFAYRHLVPAEELLVVVAGPPAPAAGKPAAPAPVGPPAPAPTVPVKPRP